MNVLWQHRYHGFGSSALNLILSHGVYQEVYEGPDMGCRACSDSNEERRSLMLTVGPGFSGFSYTMFHSFARRSGTVGGSYSQI